MTSSLFTIPESKALSELLSLAGKTAVVTGGGRGLGKYVVKRFAEAGANVVIAARHADQIEAVAEEFANLPGRRVCVSADVGKIEDIENIVATAKKHFGRIDILVNCAGAYPAGSSLATNPQTFDLLWETNARGTYFMSQAAAKAMIEQGEGGRIINFLSTAFEDAAPMFSAYAVSKAGVWETTRVMAHELAPYRITVNAVTPGATLTEEKAASLATGNVSDALGMEVPEGFADMVASMAGEGGVQKMLSERIPMGRMGYPDDLACAVLYFASDMASYVTGQNITVRGGQPDTGSVVLPPIAASAKSASADDVINVESSDEPDQKLAGSYRATVDTPMGTQEVGFDLRTDGKALFGTMLFLGKKLEIEEGIATTAGFSYTIRVKVMLKKMEAHVSGTRSGDSIRGTIETPMGSFSFSGEKA